MALNGFSTLLILMENKISVKDGNLRQGNNFKGMNHQASRSQLFMGFGHSWFFGYSMHLLCLAVFKHK